MKGGTSNDLVQKKKKKKISGNKVLAFKVYTFVVNRLQRLEQKHIAANQHQQGNVNFAETIDNPHFVTF